MDHFFHLAAIYDLKADPKKEMETNIEGTRNAVRLAETIGARRFHHFSSIAAAGLYEGTFREDMFEQARHLEHPYFASKHESERWCARSAACPGGFTGLASLLAIRKPARWIRSMGLIISLA